MPDRKPCIFISTAIPYANAEPHIGFGLEIVEADALARYYRARGYNVFFLTGTDENSLKNVLAAEKKGMGPKEFVDEISGSFKNLSSLLNISYDDFIRTTEERHVRSSEKFWRACQKDIYKKKYSGLYCVGCEAFYLPKDLADGLCPEHKTKPELVEEENYFFRLTAYAERLRTLIESGELIIAPEARKNEILSFIGEGLQDLSISRSEERAKGWGIPVPDDPSQIIWVWFDALVNYLSALDYASESGRFREFWQENENIIHLIGKGVIRFHAVYWPAMLMSAGLNLPKKILAHGYVTVNGEKMSKSLHNFKTVREAVERHGTEPVRYYLLREIPSWDDGDFSDERLKERYAGDLANGLGNFCSRVLAFGEALGKIEMDGLAVEKETEGAIYKARRSVDESVRDFRLNIAVSAVWDLISFGDGYVNVNEVWKIADPELKRKKVFNLLVILDNVAALLGPFLPETAEKVTKSIRWADDHTIEVQKIPSLFPRL